MREPTRTNRDPELGCCAHCVRRDPLHGVSVAAILDALNAAFGEDETLFPFVMACGARAATDLPGGSPPPRAVPAKVRALSVAQWSAAWRVMASHLGARTAAHLRDACERAL